MLPRAAPAKHRQWVMALVMAAFGAGPGLAQSTDADLQEYFRRNAAYEQAFRAGQWRQAVDRARELLDFARQRKLDAPYAMSALQSVGDANRKTGQYREALEAYEQMVAAARAWRPAGAQMRSVAAQALGNGLIGAASCYLTLGPLEQAVDRYQQAIKVYQGSGMELEAAATRAALGVAYSRSGQADLAIEQFQLALAAIEPAVRSGRASTMIEESYADALMGLSAVYVARGRFDLAESCSRRAASTLIAAKGQRHPFTARALAELARLYARQNRLREADALYTSAIDAFAGAGALDSPYALDALGDYASVLADAGHLHNAEKIDRVVLEKWTAIFGREHPQVATSLLQLGRTLNQAGRRDEALTAVEESLAIRQRLLPPGPAIAASLLTLANIAYAQGRFQQSLERIDRALAIDEVRPLEPAFLARANGIRALGLWKLGRKPEAREALDRALGDAEMVRGFTAGAERERAAQFGRFSSFYEVLADWCAEEGDLVGLFQAIEDKKARSLLDELRFSGGDLFAGMEPTRRAELQRRDDELRRRLTVASQALDAIASESSSAKNRRERLQAAATELHAARAALYQHLADMRSESPAYRNAITGGSSTRSLTDVQRSLGATEMLISYLVGATGSMAVIVRNESASFAPLTLDARQAEALGVAPGPLNQAKLSSILLGESGVLAALSNPETPIDLARLHALWQVLIPESQQQALLEGSLELLSIIPDGLLTLVPFEALAVGDAEEPEYLLDVGPPIHYSPSASVLLTLEERAPEGSPSSEPILTLGDPQYGQPNAAEDALASRLDVRSPDQLFRVSLDRLPYSGNEASWVQQHFAQQGLGVVKLTKNQATESRLRAAIEGRRLIHLACHGMAEDSFGNLFGCLAVAPGAAADSRDDGLLYAAEIGELDLRACELAILSACQTNFGPEQTGEGVWNLSRAFLAAGARRVVASDWLVNDEAAATLVSYFASNLAKSEKDLADCDFAAALQRSKQQLRRQERWVHPFYWSSLVLVGPR